jgi:hypothetical protein
MTFFTNSVSIEVAIWTLLKTLENKTIKHIFYKKLKILFYLFLKKKEL